MKRKFFFATFVVAFSMVASNSQAQSLKDLFNKDNISKVVNAVTGQPQAIDMRVPQ